VTIYGIDSRKRTHYNDNALSTGRHSECKKFVGFSGMNKSHRSLAWFNDVIRLSPAIPRRDWLFVPEKAGGTKEFEAGGMDA